MKFLLSFGLLFLRAFAKEQTEFYLPYSETEDVDFSISRPLDKGCYQWSCDKPEIIELHPIITDYTNKCGTELEFKILKHLSGSLNQSSFTIVSTNIQENEGSNDKTYTITLAPVYTCEILSIQTELSVGDDPVPFSLTCYDDKNNEFDSLDGLQINWFIGSEKVIASFSSSYASTSLTHLIPSAPGVGSILAILSDTNYAHLPPASLEFTIGHPLILSPHHVFALEGSEVSFTLMRGPSILSLDTEGYTLEVEDPTIVVLAPNSSKITTVASKGQTHIFVKNANGDTVANSIVEISVATLIKLQSFPHPESSVLTVGEDYEIQATLTNNENHSIYSSQNILCKMTLPSFVKVLEVSNNGLWARIRALTPGIGKITARLLSVLTEDDEEIEILPHVQVTKEFSIYEPVIIRPKEMILPWEESFSNTTMPFVTLYTHISGGNNDYSFRVSDEEMASVNKKGKVLVQGHKSGSVTLTGMMRINPNNYDESNVYLLPPVALSLPSQSVEILAGSSSKIRFNFLTQLPNTEDLVSYSDCSDFHYKVHFSSEDFEVVSKSSRGEASGEFCAFLVIETRHFGHFANLTLEYILPSTQKVLSASITLGSLRPLKLISPSLSIQKESQIILPQGSSLHVSFEGGSFPWKYESSSHYKKIEIENSNLIDVQEMKKTFVDYEDIHNYLVTCKELGDTSFMLSIGNEPSLYNKYPFVSQVRIRVSCSFPSFLSSFVKLPNSPSFSFNVNAGRICIPHKTPEIKLFLNVKDTKGRSFSQINSLEFQIEISNETLIDTGSQILHLTSKNNDGFEIPIKPYFFLRPLGKEGNVDVKVRLLGFKSSVLKKNKVSITSNNDHFNSVHQQEDEDIVSNNPISFVSETQENVCKP